ncbi:hypothetical protein ACFY2R_19120 [Micromonospora olivasterospora]|uniref:LacI family transcriptional regulator n=1 Tax=Micromonospora olivasterospora TaxID=1880 RepID=A0A562IFU2_MICOL|nr:hypothetical protein [Micromonospora olivasterospora]TWH69698.1 LacI family transcriptional regulator [Micromonospora olivasterospora]
MLNGTGELNRPATRDRSAGEERSFDLLPLTARTQPPLTSVRRPLREMGGRDRARPSRRAGIPLAAPPTVIPTSFTVRAATSTR